MPLITKEIILPYTTHQMFELVNNVKDYPNFIPWCKSVLIHSTSIDEIQATLILSGAGLRRSFTTCNRLQADKMIEIRLINGPFHHLEGFWLFESVSTGCKIKFHLEFELNNFLLSITFNPILHQAANILVDIFAKRAKAVYTPLEGASHGN